MSRGQTRRILKHGVPKPPKLTKKEREERIRQSNAQALRDGLVLYYFLASLRMGAVMTVLSVAVSWVYNMFS